MLGHIVEIRNSFSCLSQKTEGLQIANGLHGMRLLLQCCISAVIRLFCANYGSISAKVCIGSAQGHILMHLSRKAKVIHICMAISKVLSPVNQSQSLMHLSHSRCTPYAELMQKFAGPNPMHRLGILMENCTFAKGPFSFFIMLHFYISDLTPCPLSGP